jgi:hypothetical protein
MYDLLTSTWIPKKIAKVEASGGGTSCSEQKIMGMIKNKILDMSKDQASKGPWLCTCIRPFDHPCYTARLWWTFEGMVIGADTGKSVYIALYKVRKKKDRLVQKSGVKGGRPTAGATQ